MKLIETTIFVDPVAKGRPRFAVRGKFVQAYTPKKTADAEADVRATIRREVMALGKFDASVPLAISATFYREKPKSSPKRVTMPVTKPDVDNYGKLLLDALQKFVYPDDSQVTTVQFRKRYGSPPRIQLTIFEEGLE